MLEKIIEENPLLVGFQIYTGSQNWTKKLIDLLKKKKPSIKILVGGPHISALKEAAIKHLGADFGIVGEGEEAIVDLVDALLTQEHSLLQNIPGLIYLSEGKYKTSNINFARIQDLDDLPLPDYELLNITAYFKHMQGATVPLRGKRPVPILTSRGCPFQCTFCSSRLVFLKKIRYRSVENVVKELEYLKQNYDIDEFFVTDDNLTLDMNRAENLFDILIEKDLNLHWRAPNGLRADRLNEDLVKKMKESGCYFVGIGVETGSTKIMSCIKKSLDLKQVSKIVPILKRNNVLVSGFFMVGLPYETEGDIKKTIEFIKHSRFDRIQVSIYTPYPGSEDFDNLFDINDPEKYPENIRNYLYNGHIPKINKEITYKQIHRYQKKMLRSFYFRPSIALNIISRLKFSQVKAILNHPFIRRWFDRDHASYLMDVGGKDE
ncbi:radical SAM protein [Candidatus Woesearchaeota archaeon]|nr:radical SAM protein [Candidatus Woesearchaeota archaeon]